MLALGTSGCISRSRRGGLVEFENHGNQRPGIHFYSSSLAGHGPDPRLGPRSRRGACPAADSQLTSSSRISRVAMSEDTTRTRTCVPGSSSPGHRAVTAGSAIWTIPDGPFPFPLPLALPPLPLPLTVALP